MTPVPSISTPRTRSAAVTVFALLTLWAAAPDGRIRFGQTLSRLQRRCGFTLLELLLVLSLLVVLISLALPGIRRWQRSMPLEQAISLLQLQLQETRVAAIRSGEAWCLVLPSAGSPGRRHPLNERQEQTSQFQFQMPAGIRCEVLASPIDQRSGRPSDTGRLVFHADGTVEQSCLQIVTEDGSVVTLNVNRLTGTATIVPYSRGGRRLSCVGDKHPGASA